MARLNHSGSTNPLRHKLFPIGFAGEVMLLILETWNKFSLHHQVRHETRITAVFREALIKAYVAAGRAWFITLEDPITDTDFGTELGRNDLRCFPLNHHQGQTVFFTVECKRLRVTTKSGFTHLADKYADEGIQRFVNGQYSAGLPCGGMVGYVMDNDISQAFSSVQSEIKSRRAPLKMKARNGIRIPSAVLPAYKWSADTFHNRSDGEFAVHHVLVGVTK
jgi:hypothetical protein